jgi:hypothetical protein
MIIVGYGNCSIINGKFIDFFRRVKILLHYNDDCKLSLLVQCSSVLVVLLHVAF